jgi:hypothetical protein
LIRRGVFLLIFCSKYLPALKGSPLKSELSKNKSENPFLFIPQDLNTQDLSDCTNLPISVFNKSTFIILGGVVPNSLPAFRSKKILSEVPNKNYLDLLDLYDSYKSP